MNKIKIFKMNDCDWWAAETLDEAKLDCVHTFGGVWPEDAEEFLDDPYEVGDEHLDKLWFVDADEMDANGEPVRRTFREELNRMIESGEEFPCPFASTEY